MTPYGTIDKKVLLDASPGEALLAGDTEVGAAAGLQGFVLFESRQVRCRPLGDRVLVRPERFRNSDRLFSGRRQRRQRLGRELQLFGVFDLNGSLRLIDNFERSLGDGRCRTRVGLDDDAGCVFSVTEMIGVEKVSYERG